MAALLCSLLPVIAFLAGLVVLDTYRLVVFRRVVAAVAAGAVAAGLCYYLNTWAFAQWGPGPARLIIPLIEESLKGAYVFYAVARHRVGFPVDAAVIGFAVGSGFALVENAVYLWALPAGLSLSVWLVRGLGTASMHGGATAIAAIIAIALAVRWRSTAWAAVPALLAAVALHILYNAGLLPPLERTALLLVTLPPLLMAVFWQSERMLASWIHSKLDDDLTALDRMHAGSFLDTPGHYLAGLAGTLPPEAVADMFCLLRLSSELSAKAKGELLMREMGFTPDARDPERDALLDEFQRLEQAIGRTGRRALAPLLPAASRDQWERIRMQQPR